MNTLKIYGSSDDLIEFEGVHSAETELDLDYNPKGPNKKAEFYSGSMNGSVFLINDQLLVYAAYNHLGLWTFAPSLTEDGADFPAWKITVHKRHDYSTELRIEADEVFHVKQIR